MNMSKTFNVNTFVVPGRVLRIRQVTDMLGLSRATVYGKLRVGGRYFDPSFPRPKRLSAKAVGWLSEDLELWVASLEDSQGHCSKQAADLASSQGVLRGTKALGGEYA